MTESRIETSTDVICLPYKPKGTAAFDRDLLMLVRRRVADEENWCRGMLAADHNGWAVAPECSAAASWCLIGAFMMERSLMDLRMHPDDFAIMLGFDDRGNVETFNDRSDHYEMLALLNDAIARADHRARATV